MNNNQSKNKILKSLIKNHKHVICIALIIAFLAIAVLCFPASYVRFLEALRDLGLSIANFFVTLFTGKGINCTVNDLSAVSLQDLGLLPERWDFFLVKCKLYFRALITGNNLTNYAIAVSDFLFYVCYGILILIPIAALLTLIAWLTLRKKSTDDTESKPLKIFLRVTKYMYIPVKKWIKNFIGFVKKRKVYPIICLIEWLLVFNIATIVIELFAYYFYYIITFDTSTLYLQFYKLFLDLAVPLTTVPVWIMAIIGLILFNLYRHHRAIQKLYAIEDADEEMAQDLPIASLITGPMGTKKTTLATDLALTFNKIFRDVALKKLIENDLKFPNFPWIRLERYIKKGMENHTVYNLATARDVVRRLRHIHDNIYPNAAKAAFSALKKHCGYEYDDLYFGYDVERYGFYYFDQLEQKSLYDVMEDYAQLYFIYVIECTLIISSYSVRVDDFKDDIGNFPIWNIDFFRKDIEEIQTHTKRSNIIDFDALRLGKRVVENNYLKDALDFGIILITEIGKERGNKNTVVGRRITDPTANQLNDLFTIDVKMCRHRATVDNYPFVVFIMDEQRAASLNADTSELCDILYICDSSDFNICTPLFALDELVYTFTTDVYNKFFLKDRHNKAGNTLTRHIIKNCYNAIREHHIKIFNRYSVCNLNFTVQRGAMKGGEKTRRYRLIKWKIHSGRFATDALAGFYRKKTKRSKYGIVDFLQYSGKTATFEELDLQHSFFINDIKPVFNCNSTINSITDAECGGKKESKSKE